MTERHDVILAILGTSVVLGGWLVQLWRGTRNRNARLQEEALAAALERQSELLRERDELLEKLEDAETRCAILSALCNEPRPLARQTLR